MSDFIIAWASAIAQFEGFNTSGTIAARNHNPGNLKYVGQRGAVGKDNRGFAVFPDDQTGFQALYAQLAHYVSQYPNYSLLQITAHYLGQPAPTVNQEGNAFTYANFVAGRLAVPVTTTLSQLASSVGPAEIPDVPVSQDQPEQQQSDGDAAASSDSGSGTVLALVLGSLVFLLLIRSSG